MDAYEALKETFDDLFSAGGGGRLLHRGRGRRAGGKPGHLQSVAGGPPQCHNGVFLHHPGQAGTVLQLPGRGPVPPESHPAV